VLSIGIALICRFAKPFYRLRKILRHAVALGGGDSQQALSYCIAPIRQVTSTELFE
jgi:hypothetical protein